MWMDCFSCIILPCTCPCTCTIQLHEFDSILHKTDSGNLVQFISRHTDMVAAFPGTSSKLYFCMKSTELDLFLVSFYGVLCGRRLLCSSRHKRIRGPLQIYSSLPFVYSCFIPNVIYVYCDIVQCLSTAFMYPSGLYITYWITYMNRR